MQDLAVEDDRRALGAPAHRAGLAPPPLEAPGGAGPGPIAGSPTGVLVVTGPSGVGKGTVIRALMEQVEGLALSVSATTRAPRPGEEDGVDYHFVDRAAFEAMRERGEFLEHAAYAGNLYGTPRSELERDCRALVLEIELQGARQVAASLPEAVRVFIAPPSMEALRVRLVGRGADSPEEIERRIEVAAGEIEAQDEFRHVIVNDTLERAVAELVDLVDTMF